MRRKHIDRRKCDGAYFIKNTDTQLFWNPRLHFYETKPDYAYHYESYGLARRSAERLKINYVIVKLTNIHDLKEVKDK